VKRQAKQLLNALLLILLVGMGPLLGFWTTPLMLPVAQGELVFVCTLQGIKSIRVDPQTGQQTAAPQQDHCSALQLLSVLGQGLPRLPAPLPIQPAPVQLACAAGLPATPPATPVFSLPARAPPRT